MFGTLELSEPLQFVAEFLTSQMTCVENIFEKQLQSDMPAVNKLCRHIELYRGKMLRPALVLLSGLAYDTEIKEKSHLQQENNSSAVSQSHLQIKDSHRVIAAVCEMIHMATLVHDDVLDEADMRRKGATMNYLQGNEAAVLLGDYLISNAFHLCSSLNRPEINTRVGAVTNTLCAGELLQLHNRRNWAIDENTYFEIIKRKTASLIGLCCELGIYESGAPSDITCAMNTFGSNLGVAFQIQDDLLDLVGNENIVGKTLGKDLDKGKLTLPIIKYLEQSNPVHRSQMLSLLVQQPSHERTWQVHQLIMQSEAVANSKNVAKTLVQKAKLELKVLPDSPTRQVLHLLADAIVNREL